MRREIINGLFENPNIEQVANIAKNHGIDYIYVGENEKNKFPQGCKKFNYENSFFKCVYEESGVSIFQRLN